MYPSSHPLPCAVLHFVLFARWRADDIGVQDNSFQVVIGQTRVQQGTTQTLPLCGALPQDLEPSENRQVLNLLVLIE